MTEIEEEQKLFADFKRKLNEQSAIAQVAKLEYKLTTVKTDKSSLKREVKQADDLKLGGVCVLPCYVKACESFLGGDPQTSLIGCAGYPYGADTLPVKITAVKRAVKDGVDEVELSAPVNLIKDGNFAAVKKEFKKLKSAAKIRNLRIAFDNKYLTTEEIVKACHIACSAGITAISVPYDTELLQKVKNAVKDKLTVKADNVTSLADLQTAVDLGATVIGSPCAIDLAELILKTTE